MTQPDFPATPLPAPDHANATLAAQEIIEHYDGVSPLTDVERDALEVSRAYLALAHPAPAARVTEEEDDVLAHVAGFRDELCEAAGLPAGTALVRIVAHVRALTAALARTGGTE